MPYCATRLSNAKVQVPTMDSNGHEIATRPDASVADVAEHFGVSTRTVRRWLKSDDPPPHRRAGSAIRFRLDEVDEWSQRRAEGSAA